MKITLLLIFTTTLSLASFAQVSTTILDENDMGVTLSDGGVFFSEYEGDTVFSNTTSMYLPGCESPKGSGKFVMQGLSLWFAGEDFYGVPHLSTPVNNAYTQQFSGPLSLLYGEPSPYGGWTGSLFPVTQQEIDDHIANYSNSGYVIPESILNWPAHGRVDLGMDFNLAPFVDVNGNGAYEPENGDFPCIKGDKAVYIISNDVKIHSDCGVGSGWNLESLGIEIHYMFYQYSSINGLENTTFCKARVINRTTTTYTNFKSSLLMKGQIGNYSDDYSGTDVTRNLIYTYNGDATDESGTYSIGYDNSPPATGVVSLNHAISRSRLLNDGLTYINFAPTYPPDFWNIMNGNLLDGTPHPDIFTYTGNPYLGTGIVENGGPNYQKDMVYTIDIGDLNPAEEIEFDFAVVIGQGSNNLESVNELFNSVDFVQSFYNNDTEGCHQEILSTDNPIELKGISTYPNPSNGIFSLKVDENLIGARFFIADIGGRIIVPVQLINNSESKITLDQAPGAYLINITNDFSTATYKIIIE
ncbi:MAG: hypothetical protein ACJAV5_001936 [Vicingaceae bacterium]|jgi:hypothetical protein